MATTTEYTTPDTLIAALMHREAYDHPVDTIRLCETHISWVFLTGDFTYKIKKPVNFGFLDFSTLKKRQYYCEQEVRLNARLAPHLYLDTVPICGEATSPHINGQGLAIEYAVKMRQFDTNQEFDKLLANNKLTRAHINETAEVIANFHSSIAIADDDSAFGTPQAVQQPVLENFEQLHQSGDDWLSEHQLDNPLAQIQDWSNTQYNQLETTFRERKKNGFVRECHGDLHLRNIVIYERRITPFDCIEFNPNLRWIDVMSELAFLLMDIDDHNRPDLSRQLLNRYLEITGDYAGLSVLRFYLVYRAMVRAKVGGLQRRQSGNENDSLNREISNYITLACRYSKPTKPKLIICHGLSASGKTYLSQLLLEQTDIIRLRSDVERKRIFAINDTTRDTSGINKGIYNKQASQHVYEHLLSLASSMLNAGYSVIVDAAFLQKDQRQKFCQHASQYNVPFLILHSMVNQDIQLQRIHARQQQGLDASDANSTVLKHQLLNHEPLSKTELNYTITIDTANNITLNEVISWLKKAGHQKA